MVRIGRGLAWRPQLRRCGHRITSAGPASDGGDLAFTGTGYVSRSALRSGFELVGTAMAAGGMVWREAEV